MEKTGPEQDVVEVGANYTSTSDDTFGSNTHDNREMQRMGKKQEMNRVFRQTSLLSLTTVCMGTWQWMLLANNQGLTDGGRAGLFWSYIWTFVGYCFLAASLADMASMAPTAGGQYHWVSEFAPSSTQRVLSYASGWLATLAWQAANASGPFLCGSIVQAMISLRDPSYTWPAWHTWLLAVACTAAVTAFNIFAERMLPMMQNIDAVIYVALFAATIAGLAATGPHVDGRTALLEFNDLGNWDNTGLALMIGQISAVFALGGSDAAAHMSEECGNAGISVPRAIVWTVVGNGLMGFLALTAFIFSIPSVPAALNDPSGFPLIYALRLRFNVDVVLVFLVINWLVLLVSNIAFQAATSRQMFAFGRDGALPFSDFIGRVSPRYHLPVNAVLMTAAISILLCLIDLGSSAAFSAILSLAAVGQMGTYSISISCMLYRRLTAPHLLPKARWTLGRWGIPVNAIGAAYAWFVFFFGFWPASRPVTVDTMNWAVVMFGGTVILSLGYFLAGAKKKYAGPVTKTDGYTG